MKTVVKTLIFTLMFSSNLWAGITGTLSGRVFDKDTGQTLPGAAIVVEGTTTGAMADKNGFFMIYSLPAGMYDVSVSMIGYTKLTVRNIQINVDLNTDLDFSLSSEVLSLEEVVVTDQKKLIQSEITSSTYFISGDEINSELPINSYLDAVALLPGVVGSHIRGGRETGVAYLLDGLPIQSGFSQEIASAFPNSSIIETMVQTGGFNAEYGNATSGVVNVITKDGRNKVEGNLKLYTDFFDTGVTDNDNARRMEFDVGGPMTIGLGGPLINARYYVSADLNLSDTAYKDQLKQAFDSPVFSNYNINSKLSFEIARNTMLTFQGLLSNWKWRQYDPQWQLNVGGLAENRHYSHRLSASLIHTFSPKFFTSIRFANYNNKRQVLGDVEGEPNLTFSDPTDPRSEVTSGNQPWEEETQERINIFRMDVVGKVTSHHLLKAGVDFQGYDLSSQNTRFTAVPRKGTQNRVQGIAFSRLENDFAYTPSFFALYLQDKIEFGGVTANLGLRYDVFSPDISIGELPVEFTSLQQKLNSPQVATQSNKHKPVSPRLGISLPLSENERVHFNYGWYYQMPALYYIYANSDYRIDSYLPFTGNLELQPIRSVSTELSYKRVVSDDWLLVLTGFTKRYENLVDTQTFILDDSQLSDNVETVGYTQYLSSASGRASGIELTVRKRFTDALSSRLSYTYMKAVGTASSAEDEFNTAVFETQLQKETSEEFPLSWDQRHSIILDTDYATRNFTLNLLYRRYSPLPVTTANSLSPNDTRLSWRDLLDMKLLWHSNSLMQGRLVPFLEIRNVFDAEDVIDHQGNSGVRAYRLYNPLSSDQGRRFRIGMNLSF